MKKISSTRFDPLPADFDESLSAAERAALRSPERFLALEGDSPEPSMTPVQDALASVSDTELEALFDAVLIIAATRSARVLGAVVEKINSHQDEDDTSDDVYNALERTIGEVDDIRTMWVGCD